jgi:hypothetical protein
MMSSKSGAPHQGAFLWQSATLVLILLTFLSLVAVIGSLDRLNRLQQPWTLVLVGLAAFRGGRAVAYNFIFSWLRAPFTHSSPDSSGAGDSIHASGQGLKRVLGELLSCPLCAGTWVALVLSGCIVLVYPFGMALAFVLAAAGAAEILHWWAGRDEWQGRAAREQAGSAWLSKNAGRTHSDESSKEGFPQGFNIQTSNPFLDHFVNEQEWPEEQVGGDRKVRQV